MYEHTGWISGLLGVIRFLAVSHCPAVTSISGHTGFKRVLHLGFSIANLFFTVGAGSLGFVGDNVVTDGKISEGGGDDSCVLIRYDVVNDVDGLSWFCNEVILVCMVCICLDIFVIKAKSFALLALSSAHWQWHEDDWWISGVDWMIFSLSNVLGDDGDWNNELLGSPVNGNDSAWSDLLWMTWKSVGDASGMTFSGTLASADGIMIGSGNVSDSCCSGGSNGVCSRAGAAHVIISAA